MIHVRALKANSGGTFSIRYPAVEAAETGDMRIFATNFLREFPPAVDAPALESCHASISGYEGPACLVIGNKRPVVKTRHSIASGGIHAC